jgi:hypothetical protein
LIFLFIPLFAAIFYALFFRCRKYFVEHVVVATHFWSFSLVLLVAIVPAVVAPLMWWSNAPTFASVYAANDVLLSVFLQICIAAYLVVMLPRVYSVSYWYSAVVSLTIAWSFFHLVWLYRFVLFAVTLHVV